MLYDADKLEIISKSVLYDYLDPAAFPMEASQMLFRGIGANELAFIKEHGYIASKGKGNDSDQQQAVTCFSQLFSQAEGYAISNYTLYGEKQAYVLVVTPPINAVENELGETEVPGTVPESAIVAIIPIEQLQKSITRAEAKKVHKDLPPGGEWKTVRGRHIYVLNGKILAGSLEGASGNAKKATRAQLSEHQVELDKEVKKKKTTAKTSTVAKKPVAKTKKTTEVKPAPKKTIKPVTDKKAAAAKTTAKARKDIDAIANSRPKEKKKAEVLPKDNKKNVEAVLAGANNKATKLKAKTNTKAELDKLIAASDKKKRQPKPPTVKDLDEMFGASTPKAKPEAKKPINSRFKKVQDAGTSTGEKIPSKAANTTGSKKTKVADIRSEKQVNHDVAYDTGVKIGGARKDMAELRKATDKLMSDSTGQSLDALENMAPEVAQRYCIKKNLINPVDFEADYKNGMDIKTAMCKQLIYDRIAPKPPGDTAEDRQLYLNAIRSLQRTLEPIKSWDDFRNAVSDLGNQMKRETPAFLKNQQDYLDYAKREAAKEPSASDLMERDYKADKWNHITPEEWKAKKLARIKEVENSIKQHHEAAAKPYAPLGDKLTNFFTNYESRNRTYDTMNKKKLDWGNYFAQAKAEADKPKEKKVPNNTVRWERVMPRKIQRSGGRPTPVKKPEDMVKTFKFKGVEFGNYVDDKSGNFHLIKCAEAFQDLADILGMKDKDVSLNGSLSMAFGARGKGAALAHYEPVAKAINITKNGGAGTLAHEWGHALDNLMYQASAGHSSLNYASEGMQDQGSPAVKAAYKDVMHAIMFGNGNGKDTVENKHKTYYSFHPSFKKAVEEFGLGGAIKKATDMINEKATHNNEYYEKLRGRYDDKTIDKKILSNERKRKMDINDMVQEMAYHHEKRTGEKLDNIPVYSGHSQYYVDSSKQGGKDNKYWTSNCEMFARAFENYVEGKMKTGPIKNDYLVHYTYEKGFATCPAPYPQDEERTAIHAQFDKLMGAIRSSGAIQKALAIEALEKSMGINIAEHIDQSNRNAYNVPNTEGVLWIPVNRLSCPYQTEAALNFDKIQENVEHMKAGENLEPVVIGYDYDVHDGHHRIEASKIMKYTHIPCIVGGSNDLQVQRADEMYREIWKSVNKELPPGGRWVTVRGRHTYIKDGKVLAGAISSVHLSKRPLYSNSKRGKQDSDTSPQNKKDVSNMKKKEGISNSGREESKTRAIGGDASKARQNEAGRNSGNDSKRMEQGASGGASGSTHVKYHEVAPREFHSAIAAAKANNSHGAFVDLHDLDDYNGDKLLMSPNGGAGVAVTPDGNIISVFKDPASKEKGAMHSILMNALEHGGKKLDCFDGALPTMYAKYGMTPVAKCKFSREYAPEGWNFERDGEPDVIFMVHNGDSMDRVKDNFGKYPAADLSKAPYVDEYDEGLAMQDKYLK